MGRQNLPNKLSEEELLDLLSQEDSPETKKTNKKVDTVISFLRFYNIESGNQLIKFDILYNLYQKYEKKPLAPITFGKSLNRYLILKRSRGHICYLINKKALDLDEKLLKMLDEKKTKQTTKIPQQFHFKNFVDKFELKAGKKEHSIWISGDVLYDLYDEWIYKIRKKDALGKEEFIRFCALYFPKQKETRFITWFSLDDSVEKILNPERIAKIKARNSLNNEEKKK